MIARLIRWSIGNRLLVLLAALVAAVAGVVAMLHTPVDAIPDLSDVQVIIRTGFPGQAPRVVEDQVTYPLATTMLSVPGSRAVRGYSMFGDSYVYVIFQDGTDLYWARSRVLEYLNGLTGRLPKGVTPSIGPDATGVGWIYEYALIDRTGHNDLARLRAVQDWFLKYELQALPNVAEVACIGGMVKEYQVVVDPEKLRAFHLPLSKVVQAVRDANQETGGSVVERAEAEYLVRATGYLKTLDDFAAIAVGLGENGVPVLLKDVARIQVGPQLRQGIADLNGEGETVGGVIVMRSGANARDTIVAVKQKLAALAKSLPPGVEVVPVYDRSGLIERSVETLSHKLVEEFVVVALVCLAFLFHLRSALVAIVSLPLGVLIAFLVMRYQGVNANIMSLGGIAIAIGAMVDAAIVMIENAHKHLEAWRRQYPNAVPDSADYFRLVGDAAVEVGPALFFSLLIITVSFLPVFTLEAQEGRLFAPLAYTKTYAMAAAAGLSVTLVPVLMGFLLRGRIPEEHRNPINRFLIDVYRPLIGIALRYPWAWLVAALAALALTWVPISRVGSEFIPPLDEGDLLYMPSTLPGLSAGKAQQLLQLSDRMIKTVPEVKTVFGKIGRAETATDPAPLTMLETTIQLKPESAWRKGMTVDGIIRELDRAVRIPSLANLWTMPIRTRIDMLATGIKSPIGIKVAGPDLGEIERIGGQIETVLQHVQGTTSAYTERAASGRYLDIDIDRLAAARYGLSIAEIQDTVATGIGGMAIGETVEGLERYPIQVRFPREDRDSFAALASLPIVTAAGATVTLGALARVHVADGPAMIRSENARPNGWIYVDIAGRDIGSYVAEARARVEREVKLPTGYSVAWSGQYEFMERALARLKLVLPLTLLIIFTLLYLTFRTLWQPLLIMASLPFALIGGYWLLYLLHFNLSVAVGVGFIALAGVAAEFGVVMLIYLDQAVGERERAGRLNNRADLMEAIVEGAVLRVRPKAMTVAVILAGLLPIMLGSGTGSEVMQRIAAPMVGGMVTAPMLSMFLIPVVYLLWRGRRLGPSVR